MQKIARVVASSGHTALVSFEKQEAWGSCNACQVGEQATLKSEQIEVENRIGAKTGDLVEIELPDKLFLKAAFLLYGLPLLVLLSVLLISQSFIQNELISALLAFAAMFFCYYLLRQKQKSAELKGRYQSVVTRVITDSCIIK